MTTHTTQSAATSASPAVKRTALEGGSAIPFVNDLEPRSSASPTVSVAQALLPVRICYGKAQKPTHCAPSQISKILIANLELESRLTARKLSPLRISNRKYFAIFYPIFRAYSPLACTEEAHPRRRVPAFLITTVTISEVESSNWKQSRKENSNSYKIGFRKDPPFADRHFGNLSTAQDRGVGSHILRWILHRLFGYAHRR
jgi:hypothetical protein